MNWDPFLHVVSAAFCLLLSIRFLVIAMYSDEYASIRVPLETISALLCLGGVTLMVTA